MSENYIKPQSPIRNGDEHIYPLTTYDQIILEDGTRWNGKTIGDNEGALVLDPTGEETETVVPVNAETFSGMTYKQIMELEHGVGSFYFTLSAIDDPNAKWDWMTWELVTDKFLLGAGSTYAVGSEGGESEVTLVANNIPPLGIAYQSSSATGSGSDRVAAGSSLIVGVNSGNWMSVNTTSTETPVNNMPPYLSIFMWTRTA